MRYVVAAQFRLSKNAKSVTIAGGRVELEAEGGLTVALPLRLVCVRRDNGLGLPFADLTPEAKYNGGRSWIYPWVAQDDGFKELKSSIPVVEIFEATQEAGENIELTLEVDPQGVLKEVSRRTINVVNDAMQERMLSLANKFAEKAAEKESESKKEAPQGESKVDEIRKRLEEKNNQ